MRVLIAPDSFKGTLDAHAVTAAIAAGWRSVRPGDVLDEAPLADGGEGTLDAVLAAIPDARRQSAGSVTGPDGRPVEGWWVQVGPTTAVVELAQASGLPLMGTLEPLGATTRGLGEVIGCALDAGATRVLIGLGGSASTDGGAGALRALGLSVADASGAEIADGGAALATAARVDRTRLRPIAEGVVLLADVTAPLTGPTGAAAVFGPQKGADDAVVAQLDAALAHWATLLGGEPDAPGSGAAGGTAYGFAAAYGGVLESGADHLAALIGLDDRIAAADLVLTGEGRFDGQSTTGKVVGRTLDRAAAAGVPAGVIAGALAADPGTWACALVDLAGSTEAALTETAEWAFAAGARAARDLGR